MIQADLSQQTVYFLSSIAFGAAFSVIYGLLRSMIEAVSDRPAVSITADVLFFAILGFLTALFALPFNKGEVRGFIVLGEAAGFLVIHFTLSSWLSKIYRALFTLIRKILQKISKIVKKFYGILLKFMHFILYNVFEIVDKILSSVKKQKPKLNRKYQNEQKRDQHTAAYRG